MRKILSVLIMSLIVILAGCPGKNSPSSPDNGGPTATATDTPCLSCTATSTPTATATLTVTATPTATSTSSATSTVTATPTVTFTATVTSTPCTNSAILGDAPCSSCSYVGYVKNQTMCKPVTLAQPGMVYDIQLYVTGPCAFLQVGLYSDNGSHYPGSLITASTPISVPPTTDQDFILSLPATLLPAGTYWLAAYGNDPSAPFAYMKQSSLAGTGYFDNSGTPLPPVFQAATCCNVNNILVQMGMDYCY